MRFIAFLVVFFGLVQTASAQMDDVEDGPTCQLYSFLRNLEPAVAEQEFAGEACMAEEEVETTPAPFTPPDPNMVHGDWSGPCGSSADCIIKRMKVKSQDSDTPTTPESR